MNPKHVLDSFEIAGTINHTGIITLKILKSTEYFQEMPKNLAYAVEKGPGFRVQGPRLAGKPGTVNPEPL